MTPNAKTRTDISIAKAIGIILVVVGHAGAPGWLSNFLYEFHMPLFFIAAGYFFSPAKAGQPWEFVGKRVKGLYLPFLKWGLAFLLLHNLFCHMGIINSYCGASPYTHIDIAKRAGWMIFMMAGYENHLLGAFWFLRSLFVASLLFMGLYCLLTRSFHIRKPETAALVVLLLMTGITTYLRAYSISLGVAQGGYRECAGTVFYAIGVLYRSYERKIPFNAWMLAASVAVVAGFSVCCKSMMAYNASLKMFYAILVPGFFGWLMAYYVGRYLVRTPLSGALAYIGNHSMEILALHFLSFKAVSALKTVCYGLPAEEIGRHPIIGGNNEFFWILYTLAGVALPLGICALYRYLKRSLPLKQTTTD